MALTANEKLQRDMILHRIRLQRYGNGVANEISKLLDHADTAMIAVLLRVLNKVTVANLTQVRIRGIYTELSKVLIESHTDIVADLAAKLDKLGAVEAGAYSSMLTSALPSAVIAEIPVSLVTWQQVLAANNAKSVMQLLVGDRTLEQWAAQLGKGYAESITRAAAQAIREGKTSIDAVKAIEASTLSARQRNNLQTLVHQSINAVAADAREETAKANTDIIKSRLWLSTLDNRTSPMCIVRDHIEYTMSQPVKPVRKGDPEYGAGPGKLHWRCRSVETWIMKSWDEAGLPNTGSAVERAALKGPVAASMNYREWLTQQTPAIQDEVLGVMRAEMLRAGKYKVSDFFDDGRMIPLKDLLK